MGLASKFAASQAPNVLQSLYPPPGPSEYGHGQQFQPYHPQQPHQQYPQSYPQGIQAGYPGTQSQGQIPHAPQQQSANLRPGSDPRIVFSILKETVDENALYQYYNDQSLHQLASDIARNDPVTTICQQWKIPLEIGLDLVKLALYDTVFLIDDSGSIEFSGLQKELKGILKSTAFATGLIDQDGFAVRFMNSTIEGNNIKTEVQAEDLLNRIIYAGATPLVSSLRDKILHKHLGTESARLPYGFKKPMIVIIITDGIPTDNPSRNFQNLIYAYKSKPVFFQIAQVGVDRDAQDFLASLDSDPQIGQHIDCTSNFEMESAELQRTNPQIKLTRELWYIKMLLGSVDRTYDTKDENSSHSAPFPPSASTYGGNPGQEFYSSGNPSGNPQYVNQQNYPPAGYPPNPSQQSYPPSSQQVYPPGPQSYGVGNQPPYGSANVYPPPSSSGQQQQYPAPSQSGQYTHGAPHYSSPVYGQQTSYNQPSRPQQSGGGYSSSQPPASYQPNPSYK